MVHEIYADSEEKFVKTSVLYAVSSALYIDEAGETAVDHDTALNLCFKGVLVYDTTAKTYYTVQSFKDDAGTLTVTTTAGNYTVTASE